MTEQEVTNCWQMYRNATGYLQSLDLPDTVRRNVAFYEGRQWAAPTPSTKNLPRPVVNLVRFVCRNKRARLVLTPVKLVYECPADPVLAQQLTAHIDAMYRRMRMRELDSRAIKDGLVKGSYCYHFYWDNDGRQLACELIDPLHVFFANPRETDEQKQQWVMVASRWPLAQVQRMADADVDPDLLVCDRDDDGVDEQKDSQLCTVLTRYFRRDGQVYVERALKRTMLNAAAPLAPCTGPRFVGDDAPVSAPKATLYPLVFGVYEERENSIYGISEVEGLVPNQRVINQILGMQALAIQNTAWGKYVVTKDALKGQQISNEPGEVLVDYSADGHGIRKMEHASLSALPHAFVEELTALTRTVSGASEIMTGEQLNNMSGTAIAQLQSQANQPIAEQRERFWRVKEKQGMVVLQCCRLYYQYLSDDGTAPWLDTALLPAQMQVTVKACTGTGASTASDVNLLETLFAKGAIDAATFVRAYPQDALCDKDSLLALLAAVPDQTAPQVAMPDATMPL